MPGPTPQGVARASKGYMRDPHVEYLLYDLEFGDDAELRNPPPADFDTPLGRVHIEDGAATIYPTDHYPSAVSAREVIDPLLRAWEIDYALGGRSTITFRCRDSRIIDRNPPLPIKDGKQVAVELEGQTAQIANGELTPVVRYPVTAYPLPPQLFGWTPDVETLWARYQGYLKGREPAQGMGYFCLTLVEAKVPKGKKRRKRAAEQLQIDKAILDTLGELTAERGGPDTARKAGEWLPLSPAEIEWIKHAVKLIIRRVGDVVPDKAFDKITMADLPSL